MTHRLGFPARELVQHVTNAVVYPPTPIAQLVDSFDSALDTSRWVVDMGTASTNDGALEITYGWTGNNSPGRVRSVRPYSLVESAVVFDAGSIATSVTSGSAITQLNVSDIGATQAWAGFAYQTTSTNLQCSINASGSTNTVNITYDPIAHRFLRIRESGGTIYLDTSADSVNWTNQHSVARGATRAWTSCFVHMRASLTANVTPPAPLVIRSVNVPASAFSGTGTLSTVGSSPAISAASATFSGTGTLAADPIVGFTAAPGLSGTGTLTVAQPWAALVEPFDGTTLDTNRWYRGDSPGQSTTVSGGTLNLPCAYWVSPWEIRAGDSAGHWFRYYPREFALVVEVVAFPAGPASAVGAIEVFNNTFSTQSYAATYSIVSGTPQLAFSVQYGNGAATTATVSYNSTDHRFFRFRESGAVAYLDTSADSYTWTNQITRALDNPSQSLLELALRFWTRFSNSGETQSSKLRIGGVNTGPSGEALLTGSGTLTFGTTVGLKGAAGLSGSGALTTAGTVTTSATLAGTGTLATSATPALATSVDLTGSGSLATVGGIPFTTLVDTFDGSVLDTALWENVDSRTVTVSGGVLTIPVVTYTTIRSVNAFSIRNSSVVVEFDGFPTATANVSTEIGNSGQTFYAYAQYFWNSSDSTYYMKYLLKYGTSSSVTVPYDATAHRWMRVREQDGTAWIESSPDGVTWTTRVTKTPSSPVTPSNLKLDFFLYFSGSTDSSALRVAGVNVYTGTAGLSGSGTLTAAGLPGATGAGNLSGTGTLSTSALIAVTGTAGLSGSGTLATTGTLGGYYRIFPPPYDPSSEVSSYGDGPVSLGVEFYVTETCWLTAFHMYVVDYYPAEGAVLTRLWQVITNSDGNPIPGTDLAFGTDYANNAWATVELPTPVELTADDHYRAVLSFPAVYPATTNYWYTGPGADGITNGPLVAPSGNVSQGFYDYGSGRLYTTSSYNGGNYWVDITVTTNAPAAAFDPRVAAAFLTFFP